MNEVTDEMSASNPEASEEVTGATFDSDPAEAEQSPEPAGASSESHEETDASTTEEPSAKHNRVQERFNELTAARRQAEREAEYWREQATKGRPEAQQKPVQQGEPTLDQFDDYDEFVVAKAEYRFEQKLRQQAQERQQMNQQQQFQEKVQRFQAKANEARAKYDDFDVVAFNPNVPISQAMEQVIISDDKGPDLAYYLGENITEAKRIASLDPYQAIMEMAAIKAKISAPPKQTSAPEPISTIDTGTTTSIDDDGPIGATFE